MSNPRRLPEAGSEDHFCAVIAYKILRGGYEDDETQLPGTAPLMKNVIGDMEFLIIRHRWKWKRELQMKFPGGGRKEVETSPGVWIAEQPLQTAIREFEGEAGPLVKEEDLNDRFKDVRKTFTRYFYSCNASAFIGSVREHELKPGDPEYDEELVGLPEWISFKEVWEGIHPAHKYAFWELMRRLAARDPFVAEIVKRNITIESLFPLEN